jgi:hypothetical protein
MTSVRHVRGYLPSGVSGQAGEPLGDAETTSAASFKSHRHRPHRHHSHWCMGGFRICVPGLSYKSYFVPGTSPGTSGPFRAVHLSCGVAYSPPEVDELSARYGLPAGRLVRLRGAHRLERLFSPRHSPGGFRVWGGSCTTAVSSTLTTPT